MSHAGKHSAVPIFWIVNGWKALRFCIELTSHILTRFGFEIEFTLKYAVWLIVSQQHFYGRTSWPAVQASGIAHRFRSCCVDPEFSEKALGKPALRLQPAEWLLSTCADCLGSCAPDQPLINLDRERALSYMRAVSFGDRARSLQCVGNASYCHQLRVEHGRLDGKTFAGKLGAKEIKMHQLQMLQQSCKSERSEVLARGTLRGEQTPWGLYFLEEISPEWRKARSAQVTRMQGLQKTGLTKPIAFRNAGDDSGDGVRWVKGFGSWETWSTFPKTKPSTFHDEGVFQRWQM